MAKKEKQTMTVDVLRPYVQRALTDPELRDDLLAAFAAARGLYGKLAREQGVKGKAEKVSEKDFQRELQALVSEVSDASDRLKGKAAAKSHRMRNRVLLLTGVTLGVLYNPWTGQATRDWIMNRVAGGDGDGLEELEAEMAAADAPGGGNGSEP